MKDLCKIIIEKDYKGQGSQCLTDQAGNKLPNQVWSRVYTGVDSHPYAIVKIFVELPTNIETPTKL